MPIPAPEAAAQSDAVFVGTVTQIATSSLEYRLDVSIDVVGSFKGLEGKGNQLVINTAKDSAACGVYFEIGKAYVIYAHQDEETGALGANSCSRTHVIEGAIESDEDVSALVAAGMSLAMPKPIPSTPSEGQNGVITLIFGVVAVVAGVVVFKIRNKKA